MKRRDLKVFIALIVLCSMLTGCGGNDCSVGEGSIMFGKTVSTLTEWGGDEAYHDLGASGCIKYFMCTGEPESCSHNTAGILEENMTKYKKALYYTLYLQTNVVMYYPVNDGYIESFVELSNNSSYSLNQVLDIMYRDMQTMKLETNTKSVSVLGRVELDVDGWDNFKVKPGEVLIPSIIRVKVDDKSITMDSTKMIGEKVVGYKSGVDFDYYLYEGVLIQVAKDVNVSDYIKLKE